MNQILKQTETLHYLQGDDNRIVVHDRKIKFSKNLLTQLMNEVNCMLNFDLILHTQSFVSSHLPKLNSLIA